MAPDGSILDRIDVNVCEQDQLVPDLAFNGERFLVAWHDRRVAPEQIFYSRVTGSGTVLDPDGIRLPGQDSACFQELVAVASNGDGFLVAWLEFRAAGMAVRAARLDAAGTVLDSAPFELSADTLGLDDVAVASDGRDYVVLWTGETPGADGADLCFRRINAAGAVLDSAPVMVARSYWGLFNSRVCFLRDRYCVVWEGMAEQPDVYAARILAGGAVLDPGGFPVASDLAIQRQPDVATDGERFFVVWSQLEGDEFDILGVFVDTAGHVGLAAASRPPAPPASVPALVRGTLYLPRDMPGLGPENPGRVPGPFLLDVSGREVMPLRPGPNDIAHLPPGVYFVSGPAAARFVLAR